jgi:serine/threonine protein kinase
MLNNEPEEKLIHVSGTPGYMAPETIFKERHSYTSDFFSLGVIMYEMMLKKRPFIGKNRQEIKEKMSKGQVKIKEPPKGWSPEIVDYINKLLIKNPEERLGSKGFSELKFHPWLRFYDWKSTYLKKEKAPFIPPNKVICSEDNAGQGRKDSNSAKYKKIKQSEIYKTAFADYQYFNKHSIKCQQKLKKFTNPHLFYNEIEKKEQAFKLISTKIDDKIKDNNKKRIASVSPVKAIKTKILGNKHQSTRKITYQEGDDFQPQIVKLNLVKVDLRKASIDQ